MMEYENMALPYNRVIRDRQIPVNKSVRHGAGHSTRLVSP